jgi:ATP-binding cassette subfamily F protein 3
MSLVTCIDVQKNYAQQFVLDGVNLQIFPGERIGLVGANGSGKTTLLHVVAGFVEPDAGQVARRPGQRIAYLPQEPQFESDQPLVDAVASVFTDIVKLQHDMERAAHKISELHGTPDEQHWIRQYEDLRAAFEACDGYRCEARLGETLAGVGFAMAQYHQPVSTLSGGQKARAALAKVLLEQPDLLLLDEPTNHLDLQGVAWLEEYLKAFSGTVIVVSHDRYFLDRVVSKILEIDRARVRQFPGNYSAYVRIRDAQRQAEIEAYDRQREFIRKQLEYVERVKSDKKRARQAAGRIKMVEKLQASDEFVQERPAGPAVVKFKLAKKASAGDLALRYTNISKSYNNKVILKNVNLDVNVGDRLGIIGPNGVGKTTLLKVTVGLVQPDGGEVKVYRPDSVAYYDQQQSDLDDKNQIIQEMWAHQPMASQGEIRNYLAPFGFRGEDVFKPVAGLSGGERSRLLLAKRIWSQPQLLLLDEPTNHLDIAAREALEAALNQFGGTVVLITHDRYLLDKVATKMLAMEHNGRYVLHYGSYTSYTERMKAAPAGALAQVHTPPHKAQATRQSKATRPQPAHRKDGDGKAARAGAAGGRGGKPDAGKGKAGKPVPAGPKLPYELLKLDAAEIEKRIQKVEKQLADKQQRFGDPAVASNSARLKQLQIECSHIERELQQLYAAWEQKLK